MAKLPTIPFKVGPAELSWVYINGDGAPNDMGDVLKYEYKATAILPLEKAKPFMEQLDAFWLEYNHGKKAKAKSIGYKEEVDDAGEKTGMVTFTFKTNTTWKNKKGEESPTIVRVFRGNGTEITRDFHAAERKTGNGSEGIIHGTAAIYDRNAAARGVTLYLSAIQFTSFKEYAGAVEVEAITEEDDGLGGDDGLNVAPVQQEPQEVPNI